MDKKTILYDNYNYQVETEEFNIMEKIIESENTYLGEKIVLFNLNMIFKIKGYFERDFISKKIFTLKIKKRHMYICEIIDSDNKAKYGDYVILVIAPDNITGTYSFSFYKPKNIYWDYMLKDKYSKHEIWLKNYSLFWRSDPLQEFKNNHYYESKFNCPLFDYSEESFTHKEINFYKQVLVKGIQK